METFEVLEQALGLIEDERHWHQGSPAVRTAPATFCAEGAIAARPCAGGVSAPKKSKQLALRALKELVGCGATHEYNDTHSHAEVVALFQEAIRAEKAKAGIPLDAPNPQPDEKTREKAAV